MHYHDGFTTAAYLRDVCPTIMTAKELMSLPIPEVEWQIPNLLPAGLALLAGPPKVGKSYLLLKFAKEIIKTGGKVFYFAGEDSHYLLRSRLLQLGLQDSEDLMHHCGREALFAKPDQFLEKIESLLNLIPLNAIFLDNMELVLPPKPRGSDDYAYYYQQLPQWAALASKHNCAIVMTHHTRKETTDNPFDAILGSQAIMGTSDTVMVMQRTARKDQFNLHATGKYIVEKTLNIVRTEAGFEFDGSELDAKLRTNVAQHKIYKFIQEHPNCNQRQIRDQLNLSQGNVSRDLKKLIVKGYVNGDTMSGYRVDRDLDNPDIPDM